MEDTFAKVEDLAAHIKEYINNRLESIKLNVAEKSSRLLSNIIALAIALLVLFMFILFASIAVAFAFAKLPGELYWGFIIVAGIYLLVGLLVWAMKKKFIQLPIMNAILHQLSNEEEDDDEED